jgi:hypothetical protein
MNALRRRWPRPYPRPRDIRCQTRTPATPGAELRCQWNGRSSSSGGHSTTAAEILAQREGRWQTVNASLNAVRPAVGRD